MLVVVRTEGGSAVGYGHLYRCISLIKAIEMDFEKVNVLFIVNSQCSSILDEFGFNYIVSNSFDNENDVKILLDKSVDLILFDSYNATDFYLSMLNSLSKLVMFDDNNDLYNLDNAYIVINGNIHASNLDYDLDKDTFFLIGSKYLVMKEEYLYNNINCIDKQGILITTGGTDKHNLTCCFMKKLQKTNMKIVVIVGPGFTDDQINELNNEKYENVELIIKPNSLKKYLEEAKYVVTACGSSVYEVLTQKSIPILFSQAENQKLAYNEFKKQNLKTIGTFPKIDFDEAYNYIKELEDGKKLNFKFDIDSKGAYRIAKFIKDTLFRSDINSECIKLRKLRESDINNVFELSNQEYVRKYSINKDRIHWKTHIKWFENILKNSSCYFYIATDDNDIFCGQVRYDMNENNTEYIVSISLDKNILNKGKSKYILKESLNLFFNEVNLVNSVTAYIKNENGASINLFEGVGFKQISKVGNMMKYLILREDFYENR